MHFIESVTLTGRSWVVLEPLQREHADELLEAAKDGALWKLWSFEKMTALDAALRLHLAL